MCYFALLAANATAHVQNLLAAKLSAKLVNAGRAEIGVDDVTQEGFNLYLCKQEYDSIYQLDISWIGFRVRTPTGGGENGHKSSR